MKILVIGSRRDLDETRQKFGGEHTYKQHEDRKSVGVDDEKCDVMLDFLFGKDYAQVNYERAIPAVIFLDCSTLSLHQSISPNNPNIIIGFSGMPTFLNRELLEVALFRSDHEESLKRICEKLGTKYQVVADKTGLVTPRVICMIINEAFCTVEEGIATREDIDVAMKLGTNYPYGPFEWCERIGAGNVVRLLEAVHKETKDDRYIVSSLLKKESRQ